MSCSHTHTHVHLKQLEQQTLPAPLFSVSELTRMIQAWGSQMEILSLKKPNFLLEPFNYAGLNGASALNRDSFVSSRDYWKV